MSTFIDDILLIVFFVISFHRGVRFAIWVAMRWGIVLEQELELERLALGGPRMLMVWNLARLLVLWLFIRRAIGR